MYAGDTCKPNDDNGVSSPLVFISFDVTDVIKEKCTDNLITFTLWTGTGREQVIASKEYSGTDAQGPTLVLEFEGEEPTPTPTVVPTATPTLKPTTILTSRY